MAKWIKASDRLPKIIANAKYNDKPGILVPTTGGCMFQAFNEGWGYCDGEPGLQYVEWLDESTPFLTDFAPYKVVTEHTKDNPLYQIWEEDLIKLLKTEK